MQRFRAWRKRSPLNAHWLDWRKLRGAVRELARQSHGVLLDIGCSDRPYEELFQPHIERYVGLEYPTAVLAKQPELWSIVDRARGKVDLWGDGHRLPFASEAVDTVLMIEVLEHVPDPPRFLAEAERVLAPGGTLLITVPFSSPLHELPGDYYRFTPRSLARLAGRAGLVVETIAPRGNFASATGSMASQFLLRTLAGDRLGVNGSVVLSPWRRAFLAPFLALVQLAFGAVSRYTHDTGSCQGYSVVAHKPSLPGWPVPCRPAIRSNERPIRAIPAHSSSS